MVLGAACDSSAHILRMNLMKRVFDSLRKEVLDCRVMSDIEGLFHPGRLSFVMICSRMLLRLLTLVAT